MSTHFVDERIRMVPSQRPSAEEVAWWSQAIPLSPIEIVDAVSGGLGSVTLENMWFSPGPGAVAFDIVRRENGTAAWSARLKLLVRERTAFLEGPYVHPFTMSRDDLYLLHRTASVLKRMQAYKLQTQVDAPHSHAWVLMGFLPDVASWVRLRAGVRRFFQSAGANIPGDIKDRLGIVLRESSVPQAVRIIAIEEDPMPILPFQGRSIGQALLDSAGVYWNGELALDAAASLAILEEFCDNVPVYAVSRSAAIEDQNVPGGVLIGDTLRNVHYIGPRLRSAADAALRGELRTS